MIPKIDVSNVVISMSFTEFDINIGSSIISEVSSAISSLITGTLQSAVNSAMQVAVENAIEPLMNNEFMKNYPTQVNLAEGIAFSTAFTGPITI